MLRLFSAFPNGRPGAGLLLMRVVIGLVVVVRAVQCLSGDVDGACYTSLSLAGVVGGPLILAGFLTPVAALLVMAALALSWPLATVQGSIDVGALLLLTHCAALALLGPGAWSVDARLFGRREILIPRDSDQEGDVKDP